MPAIELPSRPFNYFLIMLLLVLASHNGMAEDIDDATGLIMAPGWEIVRDNCGLCHSHRLVTSQRADRRSWLDTLRWMQANQNLRQFDQATENTLLDYLAENYAPLKNQRRLPLAPHLMPASHDQ
ncbi:MAG: hypothetical protein HKN08_07770 [Gammaproteobacteria bacterium]|nr:hypothetical protein [Gammaproteobacteria bacterium]